MALEKAQAAVKKHKDHIVIIGSICSVVALGYIVWTKKKSEAAANALTGPAGSAALVQTMDANIPIFSFGTVGTSQGAPPASTSAHLIGNSSGSPRGGVVPLSVETAQEAAT